MLTRQPLLFANQRKKKKNAIFELLSKRRLLRETLPGLKWNSICEVSNEKKFMSNPLAFLFHCNYIDPKRYKSAVNLRPFRLSAKFAIYCKSGLNSNDFLGHLGRMEEQCHFVDGLFSRFAHRLTPIPLLCINTFGNGHWVRPILIFLVPCTPFIARWV